MLLRLAAATTATVFFTALFVVAMLGWALPSAPPGPGQSPSFVPFDPAADGVGILTSAPADTLLFVPAIVAISAAVLLVIVGRRASRRRQLFLVGAGITVVAGAYGVAAQPGPERANAFGPERGIEMNYPPDLFDTRPVAVVTAELGEPYVLVIHVDNPGSLPVRLMGVVEQPYPVPLRWTAVGYEEVVSANGGVPGLDSAHPFVPVEVRPGSLVSLYLAGRASNCEVRSGGLSNRGYASRDTVDIAFEVLGLARVARVSLPVIVNEPVSSGPCP